MGPDELADFEARAFRTCDRATLSALRIKGRRRQFFRYMAYRDPP